MNESRRVLVEKVYAAIKDGSIVSEGKLPTEREMAALMTTSRTSMREALIVLETLGIIEVRGKQGLFVKDPGMGRLTQSLDLYATWPADVIPKVFQVRIMMESPAAGLAALNRTDADLAKMNECLAQFSRIFAAEGPEAGREGAHWNDIFHRIVIAASHNEVLIRMHEGLSSIIERAMESLNRNGLTTPRPQWPERILGEHEQIVRAIRERDEAGAREAMRKHLEISAANLEKLCQDRESALLGFPAG
mgnify:CR=1 FL=1|jgi:GntR family transcriptional repressor for pyruvate dehydrogenase complex